MLKRPFVRAFGVVFAVLSVAYVAWLLLRPNELKASASSIVSAMRSGDIDRLYEAMSIEEKQCSNLTPEKLREAWQYLVAPRIRSSKFVREEPALQTANDFQATAGVWYTDSKGTPWRIVMIANKAEGGPKTTVLFHMLLINWQFAPNGTIDTAHPSGERYLRGISAVRSKMESMGIHRVMLNPDSCISWGDLEALLLRQKRS